MNKEILKSVLKNLSEEFSYDEINALLDEELNKSEDVMDTELIELCIDALSRDNSVEKSENAKNVIKMNKKSIVTFKKILLMAAAILTFFVLSVTVSSYFFNVDADRKYVTVLGQNVVLNISELKGQNIFEKVENEVYGDVYIPPAFLEDSCSLEIIEETENMLNIDFSFSESDIYGCINIYKLIWAKDILDNIQFLIKVEQVKQLNIDGNDVLIVAFTEPIVYVFYNTQNSTYNIQFQNMSVEDVYNIINCYS